MARKALTPMSSERKIIGITALLRASAAFYKSHWHIFVPIIIIGILPGLFTNLIFATNTTPFVLLSLVGLTINIWASTTIFYALKVITDNRNQSIKELFTNSMPHVIPFILTGLITILPFIALGLLYRQFTTVIGTLLFFVLLAGAFVILVWGCFTVYVYFYEGKKYMQAFKRSKSLVDGYFWDVLQRIIVLLLFTIAVGVLFSPVATKGSQLSQQLLRAVQTLLIAPFGVYYMYRLYDSLQELTAKKNHK